ncbi:radial spoke head 10 homolog B isoform X1 [Corythoichthys intestinalis]|uniref:radial spoke head 10 homolog B isoform X1 n=2 Tax=Corythoichthys intestinalis TaxID=161448 RepID=UPI0025A5308D|nr:radial spoke head 10 homolog B isoform X1 [Corythoichthys intestinalis]
MIQGSSNLVRYSKLCHPDCDGQHDDGLHEVPLFFVLTYQRYEGDTREGMFHGRGTAKFKGGHSYTGMFSLGAMHGQGVFTWADKVTYEGEFVRNMPMGQGKYTWPDGSTYEGDVWYGVRHGNGIHKSGNVTYKGQWNHSRRHGKGTVYYNQEETSWYKGNWVLNERVGWGVRCYPSGNIYFGEWKQNLRYGEGTMRWLSLGQLYVGNWHDGVQQGHGTHVWLMKRTEPGAEFRPSNQYTGNFFQGYRHGPGIFYYAGGAIYEGGWQDNKKHGKGKVTLKDGYEFEGQFLNDKMVSPIMTANQAPVLHGMAESLGPDMTVNIDCALEKIPNRNQAVEHKQVRFLLLRYKTELRSIYRFYCRLGQPQIPGGAFLLSRMQLWRLLKDCYVHHRCASLAQLDLYIRDNPDPAEVHSPFTPIMLSRFLSCLVIIAYHIYHKELESSNYILAECFSKLLTDDIFPNAKNVKGFLFKPPERTIVAVDFLTKSWKVYQAYCKVNKPPRDDSTMTNRHILWMYQDLDLYDSDLTISRVMEILSAETLDPSNMSACMEIEIVFLEFYEVLLGCGEVKCQQMTGPYPKIGPSRSSSALARQWQQTLAQDRELDAWSHKIHHFFKQIFFPAVDLLHLL